MSGDGLFHIDANGQLVSMVVAPYDAEDVLQALLETHPDLLAGGQMTPESPRRWALVKREQGVPDREDSGYRWSVDHLFVDQDAVPTLVEVKRSTDTRIRREVVGQMLDYAANGVRYWPVESLRAAFEATQSAAGLNPAERLAELRGEPVAVEEFFDRVGDNLLAGRIRMVFVADVVPDELMRITEFLNEQMSPAEVFAVEVKQYRAEGHDGTVIVPAVYGRTATASVKRSAKHKPDRAVALAASKPSTLRALGLLGELARDLDLTVVETHAGSLMKTATGQSVACVYLASWDTVDLVLKPLRDRGFVMEADAALAALHEVTTKRPLTEKNPNFPTDDAVANWNRLSEIIADVARAYHESEEPG